MSLQNFTSEFPFEYCATRFLRQWEKSEENLFNSISSQPNEKAIIEALGYFRVARSFKGIKKQNSQLPSQVISALINIQGDSSISTPVDKVNALASRLESHSGKFTLSAASKLLWLSCRSPYIIYDSRAVNALSKKAHHKNIARNYSKFTNAWRVEYKNFEKSIELAIKNVKNGRAFMPKTVLTDNQLDLLSSQAWFKERVFDIFLWEVGV